MNIEEKVKNYAELDAKGKKIDEMKKPLNAEIKAYMKENGIKEVATAGVKAVFGIQERVSMNEARLLEKVKRLGLNQAIKVIEVVDEDAIQEMIFKGELDAAEIESCIERKQIETLTIKGAKGK